MSNLITPGVLKGAQGGIAEGMLNPKNLWEDYRTNQLDATTEFKQVADVAAINIRKGFAILKEFNPDTRAFLDGFKKQATMLAATTIQEGMLTMPRYGIVVKSNSEELTAGDIVLHWERSTKEFKQGESIYHIVREDNVVASVNPGDYKFD